mgnify:CR=1 FL=1
MNLGGSIGRISREHASVAGDLTDTSKAIRPPLTCHIEAVTSISVPGEVAGLGARQNKTRIVMEIDMIYNRIWRNSGNEDLV